MLVIASEAIQDNAHRAFRSGLLRRFAPRNDDETENVTVIKETHHAAR
jgi:hypothetical protein